MLCETALNRTDSKNFTGKVQPLQPVKINQNIYWINDFLYFFGVRHAVNKKD